MFGGEASDMTGHIWAGDEADDISVFIDLSVVIQGPLCKQHHRVEALKRSYGT